MFGAALTFSHLSVLIWIHSALKFLIPSCSGCFSGPAWWARPARVSHASSSEILVSHICRLLVSALLFSSTLNISFHFKAWRSSAIVYLLYQLKNGFYCITDERPVIKSVILMCIETESVPLFFVGFPWPLCNHTNVVFLSFSNFFSSPSFIQSLCALIFCSHGKIDFETAAFFHFPLLLCVKIQAGTMRIVMFVNRLFVCSLVSNQKELAFVDVLVKTGWLSVCVQIVHVVDWRNSHDDLVERVWCVLQKLSYLLKEKIHTCFFIIQKSKHPPWLWAEVEVQVMLALFQQQELTMTHILSGGF